MSLAKNNSALGAYYRRIKANMMRQRLWFLLPPKLPELFMRWSPNKLNIRMLEVIIMKKNILKKP